jgi:hypothetical protein
MGQPVAPGPRMRAEDDDSVENAADPEQRLQRKEKKVLQGIALVSPD